MKVELLHNTPLHIASIAIRTCWQSQDKSDTARAKDAPTMEEAGKRLAYDYCGSNDKALIDRVGNKNKHSSTLEHLTYTFYISGVSRALLQELARHRMASPSVKSTRYTLKELKGEESFWFDRPSDCDYTRASKYIVLTGNSIVDSTNVYALGVLQRLMKNNVANDIAKYCLPESYKTELTWTINARSLQNFLHLRTSKAALWEIQDLAKAIYEALPEEHKYLFEGALNDES